MPGFAQDLATVLICDDEAVLRALVRDSLAADGYAFVEARDGDEALALAWSRRPDLIVLDVMIPGRNGLEVLRELRAHPELAGTPVVVLTARAQLSDREQAAAAGATRFVSKPFSPAQLAATVGDLLGGQ